MQLGKDLVKSDIMREPVAFKKIDPNKRLTPIEALASSLNFYGRVDMDYLMQSTDSAEEEIIGDWKIQCKMPPKTKKILPPENIQ